MSLLAGTEFSSHTHFEDVVTSIIAEPDSASLPPMLLECSLASGEAKPTH
jgi:hypothetical protein